MNGIIPDIKQTEIPSNGLFGLIDGPRPYNQHQNQQKGLDQYVRVIDFSTGQLNFLKLYKNTKGLHFKKGSAQYLSDFIKKVLYVPFQIIEVNTGVHENIRNQQQVDELCVENKRLKEVIRSSLEGFPDISDHGIVDFYYGLPDLIVESQYRLSLNYILYKLRGALY